MKKEKETKKKEKKPKKEGTYDRRGILTKIWQVNIKTISSVTFKEIRRRKRWRRKEKQERGGRQAIGEAEGTHIRPRAASPHPTDPLSVPLRSSVSPQPRRR